jgi:hypothetical protein
MISPRVGVQLFDGYVASRSRAASAEDEDALHPFDVGTGAGVGQAIIIRSDV